MGFSEFGKLSFFIPLLASSPTIYMTNLGYWLFVTWIRRSLQTIPPFAHIHLRERIIKGPELRIGNCQKTHLKWQMKHEFCFHLIHSSLRWNGVRQASFQLFREAFLCPYFVILFSAFRHYYVASSSCPKRSGRSWAKTQLPNSLHAHITSSGSVRNCCSPRPFLFFRVAASVCRSVGLARCIPVRRSAREWVASNENVSAPTMI